MFTIIDVQTNPEKMPFVLWLVDGNMEIEVASWNDWGDSSKATFFTDVGDFFRGLDKEPSAAARFVPRAESATVTFGSIELSTESL